MLLKTMFTWANVLDSILPNGMENNQLETLEYKFEVHHHHLNQDNMIYHLRNLEKQKSFFPHNFIPNEFSL